MAVSSAITDSTADSMAVRVLLVDAGRGSMTRCIAPGLLIPIGMSQPDTTTRASLRGAALPGHLLRGHPARLAEALTTRDQPRADLLPQVVRVRRTAVVLLEPVAGRVRA